MANTTVIRRGKATVKYSGFKELSQRLAKLGPLGRAAGVRAIDNTMGRVFGQSQSQVPVDDEDGGQLKASGKLYKARISKSGRVSGQIQYGGRILARLAPGDSPIYAIVQHEDMSLKHNDGNAKFLERPFLANKPAAMRELENELKGALNRV